MRKSEVRKWKNGEMGKWKRVRKSAGKTSGLVVAIDWQGMERRDIMGNKVWLRAPAVR